MQASQSPASFVAPFANSAGAGFIRTIPTNSQIGIQAGAASLHDGFPPVCFIPVAAGGTPPWGQDTNGILNQATAGVQWTQVGGQPVYNGTFSTAIGGYPNGAILQSADGTGFWRSMADNNTSNPDTGGANWAPMFFSTSASIALTNANVTLSAAQYSKPIIVLTGTMTGNVALTFPAFVQQWAVINATTGAFSVTALTSGGASVTLAQGGKALLRGNGTNVVVDPLQVGAATQPSEAMQLGQATGRLIGAPQLFPTAGTFTYTPTPGMTFAIMKVQGAGAAGAGASVPSVGNVSLGAPGTCGAYGEGLFTAAAIGASQTVTIGAGGAAGPNAAGGNGGASSVGSLISAPGGIGGSLLNNQVPPQYNGNGSATSAPTGANIFSCVGTCQGYSASFSAALSLGGAGGSSVLGSGPPIAITNSNGTNATNPGCGGSGVGAGSGSAILSGGTGFKGFVEIWEYF